MRRTTRLLAPRDAGQKIGLPRAPAAAVVARPVEDVAEQQRALRHVCLGQHTVLAAAVAGDAQIP
jgi:hypothetical protein